jgi:DNA-binding NtrC family response regulator
MPGLSGIEALPAIRALAPDAKVIMVSGHTGVETSKRALAHGAFDYGVKPIDLAYLCQSLETALTMKQAGI